MDVSVSPVEAEKIQSSFAKLSDDLSSFKIIKAKGNVRVVMTGDQKFLEVVVDGKESKVLLEVLNDAIKESNILVLQGFGRIGKKTKIK